MTSVFLFFGNQTVNSFTHPHILVTGKTEIIDTFCFHRQVTRTCRHPRPPGIKRLWRSPGSRREYLQRWKRFADAPPPRSYAAVWRWPHCLTVFQVTANTDSSMSGYLQRSKGSKKHWKRLWFVIKDKVLYTYAASEVSSPHGRFLR